MSENPFKISKAVLDYANYLRGLDEDDRKKHQANLFPNLKVPKAIVRYLDYLKGLGQNEVRKLEIENRFTLPIEFLKHLDHLSYLKENDPEKHQMVIDWMVEESTKEITIDRALLLAQNNEEINDTLREQLLEFLKKGRN